MINTAKHDATPKRRLPCLRFTLIRKVRSDKKWENIAIIRRLIRIRFLDKFTFEILIMFTFLCFHKLFIHNFLFMSYIQVVHRHDISLCQPTIHRPTSFVVASDKMYQMSFKFFYLRNPTRIIPFLTSQRHKLTSITHF